MIDFLIISGIKSQTIEKIKENPSNVYDLQVNKEECIKIITFLRLIGINDIDGLLLNSLGLFFKTKDEVVELFYKYNIQQLVNAINQDINNIDIIFQ